MKKIPTNELEIGMHVVNTGLSWMEHPYLYADAGKIQSEEHIEKILADGFTEVIIDLSKGTNTKSQKQNRDQEIVQGVDKSLSPKGNASKPVPLAEEIGQARELYADSIKLAREFVTDVRLGRNVDHEKSEHFVENVIDSVMRNDDALVSLTKLRTFDEYTYTHSINVAVLVVAFGKFLKLPRKHLQPLGLAAVYHDIGKSLIPEEILNKPAKLTDAEFKIMQEHPAKSLVALQAKTDMPDVILKGIVQHHEKYNGKGYPHSLPADQIHPYATLISVVDVYDALTSNRVYKPGMPANKAISIMYSMREKEFFPGRVEQFIKCLGIYPVGSFVKLSNNEYAVVSASNHDSPLHPEVKIIMDTKQRTKIPKTIDLALDAAGKEATGQLSIVECLDHTKFNINPADYLI